MNRLHQIETRLVAALPESGLKRRLRSRAEDLRFVVVGGSGFLVNLVGLWILHGRFGLPLFPAQLMAAELALLSNFTLHHNWTYRDYHPTGFLTRLGKFHATAWTGALLSSVIVWAVATYLKIHYLIALVIGAAAGLVWNYLVNKRLIWSKRPA